MKTLLVKTAGTILLILLSFTYGKAQTSWVKSMYSNCYYRTNGPFTWSGDCYRGYCHGYGTIQWYDKDGYKGGKYVGNIKEGRNEGYGIQYYANGYKSYEGYWKNDMHHGNGTEYLSDGSVAFSGRFVNGEIENYRFLNSMAHELGDYVMENIFDGGTNLRTRLIKFTDHEIQVAIYFNGNIILENEYYMILVLKDTAPFVDFKNYNDNAGTYLSLRLTAEIINELYKMAESDD